MLICSNMLMSVSPKLMYWNKCATIPVETDLVIMERFCLISWSKHISKKSTSKFIISWYFQTYFYLNILFCRYDKYIDQLYIILICTDWLQYRIKNWCKTARIHLMPLASMKTDWWYFGREWNVVWWWFIMDTFDYTLY